MKGRQREAANPIRGHSIFPYRPELERRGEETRRWRTEGEETIGNKRRG